MQGTQPHCTIEKVRPAQEREGIEETNLDSFAEHC